MIVAIEGTSDVTDVCLELMQRMEASLVFSDCRWIQRTGVTPFDSEVHSVRGRSLLKYIAAHEFDLALRSRIDESDALNIVGEFYWIGLWRTPDLPKPSVVFYIRDSNDDHKLRCFMRFVHIKKIKHVSIIEKNDECLYKIMANILDKL